MSPREPLAYPDEPHEPAPARCHVCGSVVGLDVVRVSIVVQRGAHAPQSCVLERAACASHWRRVAEGAALVLSRDVPERIAAPPR